MTIKDFFSFKTNKYFWVNLMAMAVTTIILVFGVMKGLDIYTHHGQAVVVPDVKGMTVNEARLIFGNNGLRCVVADSTYIKNKPSGNIIELNPAAGQKVKAGRVIYLTINTLDAPMRAVPDVADNSSVRQAQAKIMAAGFKLTENEQVSGELDWVYGVKYQGRMLRASDKVPLGGTLTLLVGNGSAENDSNNDASAELNDTIPTDGSTTNESWF